MTFNESMKCTHGNLYSRRHIRIFSSPKSFCFAKFNKITNIVKQINRSIHLNNSIFFRTHQNRMKKQILIANRKFSMEMNSFSIIYYTSVVIGYNYYWCFSAACYNIFPNTKNGKVSFNNVMITVEQSILQ